MTTFADIINLYRKGDLSWDLLCQASAQTTAELDKSQGAVYTPQRVVERLIDGIGVSQDDVVVEPSCGRAAFLVPILERVRGLMDAHTLLAWANTHLVALDVDAAAIEDAKGAVAAWFWRTFQTDVAPTAFTFFRCTDALAWAPGKGEPTPTVVVGNPPYVRFQNLDPALRDQLAARFRSCASGNVDLYYAFLEKALDWAPRTAFVVPHGFLTTRSGRALRALLDGSVLRIDDHGAERVFPGVGTYVALVFLHRGQPTPGQPVRHVPTGRVSPFTVDLPKPMPVRRCAPGIATLCDAAFRVTRQPDGRFVADTTGVALEPTFVRPLVKITTIHRQDPRAWTSFIVHPYDTNGKPVDEATLRGKAPRTWAHLTAVRAQLDARDKGDVADYPAWYAYGRSQGLAPTTGAQVLVVPAMVGGACLPRLFDVRPLLPFGRPVFSSGYVVDNPSAEDRAAILSTGFLDAAADVGNPRPGKDGTYYSVASSLVKTYQA
jgi:adenine-specific DNA-methyltransferase